MKCYLKPIKKANERSFISAQHSLENVPDPIDNNLNKKRVSAHYEPTNQFIFKKFDDLQSRIANLKSVKNLKEFKHDSVLIKKWSPTYLLPEFEIILDHSLAFTIKVYKCGCY